MAKGTKGAKGAGAAAAAINLAAIVEATNAGGFLHVNTDAAAALVSEGMIVLNENIKNEAGEVAARATPKGIASMTTTAPAAGEPAKPTFAIEVSPALAPAKRNSGGRSDTYPFADLVAPIKTEGQPDQTAKFFVPATADKPEPWASLSSTVSAASKRYATKTGTEKYTGKIKQPDGSVIEGEKERDVFEYSRKFRISEGEKAGVKGAWIERVL